MILHTSLPWPVDAAISGMYGSFRTRAGDEIDRVVERKEERLGFPDQLSVHSSPSMGSPSTHT